MRYLLVLFLVMVFIVGCGCSNILTPPAHAQETADVWPAFFGVDNGGPDEGWMVFYDQEAAAWQAPRLIDNDLLNAQWTPQRQGIGYATDGKYNVSFIEATGNDLEIWESPDDYWLDDAGAWAMTDNDASANWLAVDVETRQNYIWGVLEVAGSCNVVYINLAAGVPAWTPLTSPVFGFTNSQFSFILDDNLFGALHLVYNTAGNIEYRPVLIGDIFGAQVVINPGASPQIIVDIEERLWTFYTDSNILYASVSLDQPLDNVWGIETTAGIYTATGLDQHYHATWLKMDDTIHVALVDASPFANATHLIYLRRTPNGWDAPVVLLTVDGDPLGDNDGLVWPQITVDPFANIFIYFIYQDTIGVTGDLQGFYLDNDDYDNPVAGSWVRHLNIDQSADVIEWVVAQDDIQKSGDM